jgi:hypothetical protein
MWASTTSVEEIVPDRIAAAVSSADHCQTGPFGGRPLAGFRDTAFFCAFAPAPMRPADFFIDFFGAAYFAPLFRLTTVFFAISCPVAVAGTVEAPGFQVETGAWLLNVRSVACLPFAAHAIAPKRLLARG